MIFKAPPPTPPWDSSVDGNQGCEQRREGMSE